MAETTPQGHRNRRSVTARPDQISFTIHQASAVSGLSRSALYRCFTAGTLIPRKIGGRTLILGADLHALVEGAPTAAVRVTGERQAA